MLSTPRIFYDTRSEVIKGHTVKIHCQTTNGTPPISYRLLKANKDLESRDMDSNEPAVFKDNPTEDTEYQCIVDNCHSHAEMITELLPLKVIGKLLCYDKKSCEFWALVHIFKSLWLPGNYVDNGSGWYMGNVHLHDMWQSRTKAQVNEAGKYQGAIVVASSIPFEKLSNELLKQERSTPT